MPGAETTTPGSTLVIPAQSPDLSEDRDRATDRSLRSVTPAASSAAAPSASVGISIVSPATSMEFWPRPLNTAIVRVVKLRWDAIDQSVSPGWTVCDTAALAGGETSRSANDPVTAAKD